MLGAGHRDTAVSVLESLIHACQSTREELDRDVDMAILKDESPTDVFVRRLEKTLESTHEVFNQMEAYMEAQDLEDKRHAAEPEDRTALATRFFEEDGA